MTLDVSRPPPTDTFFHKRDSQGKLPESAMVAAFLLATVLTHRDKDAKSEANHEYLFTLIAS